MAETGRWLAVIGSICQSGDSHLVCVANACVLSLCTIEIC